MMTSDPPATPARMSASGLIAAFRQPRGNRAAWAQLDLFLRQAPAEEIGDFADAALRALPDAAGMIDSVLCRLPQPALRAWPQAHST